MKKFITSILLLAGLATATSSCKKDDTTTPTSTTMAISGDMTGANSVPAATTSGKGTVTGTFVKDSKGGGALNYSIAYSDLSGPVAAGHFHIGAPGVASKEIPVSFTNVQTSPITGTAILTPAQTDELLKGNFYANLHTAKYGDGEIRANVAVK